MMKKQNKTEQNRTEQNRTEQNRTEQNRTKQNKTKQNKTKQNKNKTKPKKNTNTTVLKNHFISNLSFTFGNSGIFKTIKNKPPAIFQLTDDAKEDSRLP